MINLEMKRCWVVDMILCGFQVLIWISDPQSAAFVGLICRVR